MILLQLFFIFFRLSLISFGGVFGVLPELERMLVTEHHWLTHDQFIQSYVMAQFVPGPNMVMCPMIGYRIAGWSGFVTGLVGIYLAPIMVMGAAFFVYNRYHKIESVRRVELALRPLVVGLLSASALQLWWTQAKGFAPAIPVSIAVACFFTVAGLTLSLRKKFGATQLIFGFGLCAWLMQTMHLF